ncbi:MAG: InlB B-repeat-containing protein [Clostridiaceae bacterium]|nr:InlB B-repeat-containing protein [Clostridiaceae bacterium]
MKKCSRLLMVILLVALAAVGLTACEEEDGVPAATELEDYTVIFNSNGGSSVQSVTIKKGEKIIAPNPAPTKGGYSFEGWYKEEGLVNTWNFAVDTVISNVTLYAKWEVVSEKPRLESDLAYVLEAATPEEAMGRLEKMGYEVECLTVDDLGMFFEDYIKLGAIAFIEALNQDEVGIMLMYFESEKAATAYWDREKEYMEVGTNVINAGTAENVFYYMARIINEGNTDPNHPGEN